jgi:uracil-DNA glycosylase family 4
MVDGPHCDGCCQQAVGQRLVRTDGLGTNGIIVAGDSPWVDEIAVGRPFAGASGGLLDRAFDLLGVRRSEFLICNSAMWCKPPHLGWTDHPERYPDAAAAMAQCKPYFDELVASFKPKAIVTLGNVALRRVAGVTGLDARHSYVHASPYGVSVIPTYHPSFILQGNQKYMAVLIFALRRALEVAAGAFRATEYELLLDPKPQVAENYLRRATDAAEVICDIETPESHTLSEEEAEDTSYTIVRIGFSTALRGPIETRGQGHEERASAISIPWEPPYSTMALRALSEAKRLVFWNKSFDLPRLRAAGATPCQAVVDAMWAWHFLQSDLPKALGFVAPFYYSGPPWKHLSAGQPAFYNAMDAAVTATCWAGIKKDLEGQGRLEAFNRHCSQTDPILDQMGLAGLAVDTTQRQAFMSRIQAEYDDTYRLLQAAVPTAVKPKKLYKRQPKSGDYEEISSESPRITGGGG